MRRVSLELDRWKISDRSVAKISLAESITETHSADRSSFSQVLTKKSDEIIGDAY